MTIGCKRKHVIGRGFVFPASHQKERSIHHFLGLSQREKFLPQVEGQHIAKLASPEYRSRPLAVLLQRPFGQRRGCFLS